MLARTSPAGNTAPYCRSAVPFVDSDPGPLDRSFDVSRDFIAQLPLAAACVTIALGALGLLNPSGAQKFTGVSPGAREGISEIRATYGGFFLALGVMALMVQQPLVFMTVGIAWCGAAAARFLSLFVDSVWTPKNVAGVLFEAAVGAAFLAPRLAKWF